MPDTDLSPAVPPDARWVKIRYEMRPARPNADLSARLWSGPMDDAITIRGPEGEVFIKLAQPQRLSYAKADEVTLKLKVVAYKSGSVEKQ
jgi:hypothetical protein